MYIVIYNLDEYFGLKVKLSRTTAKNVPRLSDCHSLGYKLDASVVSRTMEGVEVSHISITA